MVKAYLYHTVDRLIKSASRQLGWKIDWYSSKLWFVPNEDMTYVEEALTDAGDLAALRAAKIEEQFAPGVPLEEVLDELGLAD